MTNLGDGGNPVRVRRVIHRVKLNSSAFDSVYCVSCAAEREMRPVIRAYIVENGALNAFATFRRLEYSLLRYEFKAFCI